MQRWGWRRWRHDNVEDIGVALVTLEVHEKSDEVSHVDDEREWTMSEGGIDNAKTGKLTRLVEEAGGAGHEG